MDTLTEAAIILAVVLFLVLALIFVARRREADPWGKFRKR